MSPKLEVPLASKIEHRKTAEILEAPRNPRVHSAEQVARIAESIRSFGFASPLLLDRSGRLVAGHGRLAAARMLGLELVPTVLLEHLTEEQARAYLIADNRLAELSEWNPEDLALELREIEAAGQALDLLGFSERELDELGARSNPEGDEEPEEEGPENDPSDEIWQPSSPTVTRAGDLWILGKHRLLCGDMSEQASVSRLLAGERADCAVTDPPYAIYGSSSGLSSSVTDDKIVRPFFVSALRALERSLAPFAHAYVFCDWRSWPSWWESAKRTRLAPKNLLIWDKGRAGLGANYANTYEAIGLFSREPIQTAMTGNRPAGCRQVFKPNLLRVKPARGAERLMNAAKPIALVEQLLTNSSDAGALVLDLFCGSGTTLVAAERSGRRGLALDVDPRACDLTIERWRSLGFEPAKLESGETFAAVAEARAEK